MHENDENKFQDCQLVETARCLVVRSYSNWISSWNLPEKSSRKLSVKYGLSKFERKARMTCQCSGYHPAYSQSRTATTVPSLTRIFRGAEWKPVHAPLPKTSIDVPLQISPRWWTVQSIRNVWRNLKRIERAWTCQIEDLAVDLGKTVNK